MAKKKVNKTVKKEKEQVDSKIETRDEQKLTKNQQNEASLHQHGVNSTDRLSKNDIRHSTAKDLTKKQKIQFLWVIGFAAIVILSVIGIYLYAQSLNKFSYAGINWEKINQGSLVLYHGRFPIIYMGQLNGFYNLYFRNDPRTNNISLSNLDFTFYKDENMTLTTDPETEGCRDLGLAAQNFVGFFSGLGYNVTGATTDINVAKARNSGFANCSSAIGRTVIVFQKSNETSITQDVKNQDCYVLSSNCENLMATERFITGVIAQVNGVNI